MDENRKLTDEDVKSIVDELKRELFKDFQLEVAKGVIGWVKKAVVVILIYLALQGIAGDKAFLQSIAATGK